MIGCSYCCIVALSDLLGNLFLALKSCSHRFASKQSRAAQYGSPPCGRVRRYAAAIVVELQQSASDAKVLGRAAATADG